MFTRWKGAKFLLLALLLVIAAGCQAVGGVDIGKALLNQAVAESMEGKLEVGFQVELDEDSEWIDETERSIAALLGGLKLVIDDIKMESWDKASYQGRLIIHDAEVGFQAAIEPAQLTLQVDGVNAPIVFVMEEEASSQSSKAFISSFVSLVFKHAPNPKNVNVSWVNETINGQSVMLSKLHAEIQGPELLALTDQLFRGLLKDDQGLKQLAAHFYDTAVEAGLLEELASLGDLYGFQVFIEDRELAVEMLHAAAKGLIGIAIAVIHPGGDLGLPLYHVFTEDTSVTADFFIDSRLNIRKTDMAIKVAPDLEALGDASGIASVQMNIKGEYWNHNQKVTADVIDTAGAEPIIIDPEAPAEIDFMQHIDRESKLYRFLKEELQLMRKILVIQLMYNDYMPLEMQVQREDGVLFLPAPYFAESLGLFWEMPEDGLTLTLIDPENGTTLEITLGEEAALLNGEAYSLGKPAYLSEDGILYIPLRSVSNALGAEVFWDGEWQTVTVVKD